jgi:hypothetical protein
MVSKESVEAQLIKLGFNIHSWVNRAEVRELPNILLPDEEIYECVNGYYEGGLALLVATNVRVLLIDKKPLNFLTVEDLRFDMINQMDYSHRMMGAQISISAGNKNLRFRSYNQPRLRKLINHVQHCIAEIKKRQTDHQEDQSQHLERINQQLQTYLLSQYQSQLEFNQRLRDAQAQGTSIPLQPPTVKPEPELADFLYSQSLLRQHAELQGSQASQPSPPLAEVVSMPAEAPAPVPATNPTRQAVSPAADAQLAELYAEGRREIFGSVNRGDNLASESAIVSSPGAAQANMQTAMPSVADESTIPPIQNASHGLEINPLRIAYSKLPMALRNRKFGRPSFHAHSRATNRVAPIAPV